MCNEAARRIALGQVRDDFADLKIPLRFPEGLPNMAPLDSVRITDPTVIVRGGDDGSNGGGADAVTRRWSWPGANGKPVYNYRSDGRDLRRGRCLIPVDGFYEFTDPGSPPSVAWRGGPADPKAKRKDKWIFTRTGEDWFCIAGLWRRDEKVGEAFAMLTTEPGPDIAPYHARQVVVVERADWAAWLSGAAPSADICRPLPAGSLSVAAVVGTPAAAKG